MSLPTVTVTKYKTTGKPLYPPAEIREQTKVRRAWLETQCTEINAQDGLRANVRGMGTGQYVQVQTVTVYEAPAQQRGICQACGISHAVDEANRVALHGYARPGDGYVIGRCSGTYELPANQSLVITHAVIDSLKQQAARCRKEEADLQATIDRISEEMRGSAWGALTEEDRAKFAHQRECESKKWKARSQATGCEDYIAHLEQHAIPALGTAYTLHAK